MKPSQTRSKRVSEKAPGLEYAAYRKEMKYVVQQL
jgi:hypothetical protein